MDILMDRSEAQTMTLSQLSRDMVLLESMAAAQIPNLLMGSSPPALAMANSQLLEAPQEVMVAVLRATAMGSPRGEAMTTVWLWWTAIKLWTITRLLEPTSGLQTTEPVQQQQ